MPSLLGISRIHSPGPLASKPMWWPWGSIGLGEQQTDDHLGGRKGPPICWYQKGFEAARRPHKLGDEGD